MKGPVPYRAQITLRTQAGAGETSLAPAVGADKRTVVFGRLAWSGPATRGDAQYTSRW